MLDVYGYILTVTNADDSVSTSPLDVSQVYAIGDDGTTYGVNASGTLYDANGDATQGIARTASHRSSRAQTQSLIVTRDLPVGGR